MERHSTLNNSLNDSCKNSNLTSWTKHVNKRGSVYTIRFDEGSAILDPNDPDNSKQIKNITYKPKSRYHTKRDFLRMEGYNASYSLAHCVERNAFCDVSYPSGIQPCKPVLDVNNQANQLPYQADESTHELVFCPGAHSQAMSDSDNNSSSVVKQLHESETHTSPLVEFECISHILPLVLCEATESRTPLVQFERAESLSSPVCHEHTNHISLPALNEDICNHDDSYSDFHHDYIPDSSYESQHTLERGSDIIIDIDSNSGHVYSPPIAGYVEKELSSKDLLCNSCSATVPTGTDMLYCDSCSLHLCGNCMLSESYSHSLNCTNKLRYMRSNEMHFQYVPDSKDNSFISDISRPPESCDIAEDQKVPSSSYGSVKEWIQEINAEAIKLMKTSIENAIHESFRRRYDM